MIEGKVESHLIPAQHARLADLGSMLFHCMDTDKQTLRISLLLVFRSQVFIYAATGAHVSPLLQR